MEDKSDYLICTNYCIFSEFFARLFCYFLKFLVWFVYKISVGVVCRKYSKNAVVLLLDCDCDFVNYLLVFVLLMDFIPFWCLVLMHAQQFNFGCAFLSVQHSTLHAHSKISSNKMEWIETTQKQNRMKIKTVCIRAMAIFEQSHFNAQQF